VARAQAIGNLEPVQQLADFELAWNGSVQPITNSILPGESVPTPIFPVIQPSVPDMPSPSSTDSYVPLSGEQRWHNFWNDTLLSPLSYVGAFGGAYGQQMS
jgi:hypothetical protein